MLLLAVADAQGQIPDSDLSFLVTGIFASFLLGLAALIFLDFLAGANK